MIEEKAYVERVTTEIDPPECGALWQQGACLEVPWSSIVLHFAILPSRYRWPSWVSQWARSSEKIDTSLTTRFDSCPRLKERDGTRFRGASF
jgi:hypothetical protein